VKILVSSPAFCKPAMQGMVEYAEQHSDEVVVNPYGRTLKKEEILELWAGVDGIVAGVEPYTADVLAQAPKGLQVISRYGTGHNSVDSIAAGKQGIKVTNTPGVNAAAVADAALGLILATARRIPQTHEALRKGIWNRHTGVELAGKVLGIVGLGAIGKEVALRAQGFGMQLIAYDPFFDHDFAKKVGVAESNVEELFRVADIVTLHVPVTDETRSMVDAERLNTMKNSAFLINTARGELVREKDLYEALKEGGIAGAGLDVFEEEPVTESPLFALDNVVVTPHMAGHTNESEERMAKLSIDNTIAVITGKACKHVVNLDYLP
jgi:D-3-phosphoglycerate dehydrogenase